METSLYEYLAEDGTCKYSELYSGITNKVKIDRYYYYGEANEDGSGRPSDDELKYLLTQQPLTIGV